MLGRVYHLTHNGDVVACRARKRPCKFGADRHFDTLAKAYEAADAGAGAPRDAAPTGWIWVAGDAIGGAVTTILSGIGKALTGGH